jgi:putative DNA primase/helicase
MRSRGEDAIRDAVAGAAEADDDGVAASGSRDLRLARKPLNDSGNGERLRLRYGRDLLFVPEIGPLAYTGSHWSPREGEKRWALSAQKTAAAMMLREAPELAADLEGQEGGAKRLHEFRDFALQSGNQARLNAMQSVSQPHLQKLVDELDSDPFLFNVQNGTLELGSKSDPLAIRRRRHSRLDHITHIAPIGHDPDAECPRFHRFLDDILPDREVQDWLQRWYGYCLSADFSEHKVTVLHGEGRNGKGVLAKTIQWVLGDYAAVVQFQSFVDAGLRRGAEPSPDLAKLMGARAVFASEAKKGSRLDDGLIKQLTGGDPAAVRKLHRDFFDLTPTFTITLICNNKPQVRDDSHGMWSRVMLVPFTVIIPEHAVDKDLLDKLKLEGPGILNWLLDGFRRWREQGLGAPQAIWAATADYRAESDQLGLFLETATIADPASKLRADQLYACYEGWSKAMELRSISLTKFGMELKRRGYCGERDGGRIHTWRHGLKWSDGIDWEWQCPS